MVILGEETEVLIHASKPDDIAESLMGAIRKLWDHGPFLNIHSQKHFENQGPQSSILCWHRVVEFATP
jgi:hypothetical protein